MQPELRGRLGSGTCLAIREHVGKSYGMLTKFVRFPLHSYVIPDRTYCYILLWNRRFRWSLWNPNRWSLCNIKHNATRRQPLNSDLNPDGRKQGPWSPGTNHIHAWIPQVGYTNSEPTNESSRSRKIGTLCERANQRSRIPLEEGYPDFVYK